MWDAGVLATAEPPEGTHRLALQPLVEVALPPGSRPRELVAASTACWVVGDEDGGLLQVRDWGSRWAAALAKQGWRVPN